MIDRIIPDAGKISVLDGPTASGKATLLFGRILRESIRRQSLLKCIGAGESPDVALLIATTEFNYLPPVVPWFNYQASSASQSIATFLGLDDQISKINGDTLELICNYCKATDIKSSLANTTIDDFLESLFEQHANTKVAITAILSVPNQAQSEEQILAAIDRCSKMGFDRWLIDGKLVDSLQTTFSSSSASLECIIDRVTISNSNLERVREASNVALLFATKSLGVRSSTDWKQLTCFSPLGICMQCGAVGSGVSSNSSSEITASTLLRSHSPTLQNLGQLLSDCGLRNLELSHQLKEISRAEATVVSLLKLAIDPLQNALYLFDEPCAGMHHQQVECIVRLLQRIAARSNAIMVSCSDGSLTQEGEVAQSQVPSEKVPPCIGITLFKNSATIPLNRDITFCSPGLNVVGGPAGSGKRRVVDKILAKALADFQKGTKSDFRLETSGCITTIRSTFFDSDRVGKRDITVASTLGLLKPLQELFLKLPLAAMRGLNLNTFASTKIDLQSLRGIETQLWRYYWDQESALNEENYPAEIREIRFRGLNFPQFMKLPIANLVDHLKHLPFAGHSIKVLQDFDLLHLAMGTPIWVLSHGEQGLLRIAHSVLRSGRGSALYLFDHPTCWLDKTKVSKLIGVFKMLVKGGHTIICTDNNRELIEAASCYVSLGHVTS